MLAGYLIKDHRSQLQMACGTSNIYDLRIVLLRGSYLNNAYWLRAKISVHLRREAPTTSKILCRLRFKLYSLLYGVCLFLPVTLNKFLPLGAVKNKFETGQDVVVLLFGFEVGEANLQETIQQIQTKESRPMTPFVSIC